MRSRITVCSLIALLSACRTSDGVSGGGPLGMEKIDGYNIDYGPFDSPVLKITWFRFAQIVAEVNEGGRRMAKTVRWEPQWFGIFSHSWLRIKGAQAEEYLGPVKDLRMTFNRFGFPDRDVRRMVGYLILSCHLKEVPDVLPGTFSPEWFDRLQRLPISVEAWEREVGMAKILVVESDKGRKIYLHLSTRDRADAMAKSKALHTEAARLMATFAPDAGGMRIDPEK